jgi:MoaA/NifB/PqqE/SkfB family radical SAM enzyme
MRLGRLAMSRLKALAGRSDAIIGHVDRVEGPNTVVGWALDRSAPGRRLVVECVQGDRVLGAAVADEPREDVRLAGMGDGRCGFRLTPLADALAALADPTVRIRVRGTDRPVGGEVRLERDVFLWLVAADVVDNCNLRCPFCLYDYSGVTSTHLMSEATFRKLASLARGVAAGQFYISCLHEPTLHPRLNDLLALIPEDLRHKVFFTTNLARPLKDADFEAWARSGLHHINVSLDTLVPERFAVLRKFGRFEVFTANLDRMAAIFRRVPGAPALRYITMAFRSNLEEIPEVVRVSRDRWLSTGNEIRYTFNVAHITDEFRRREYLFPSDWETLTERLNRTGVPFVIAPPPADGYEETIKPSQNFFEDRAAGLDDQARLTLTRPLGLRVAPDGTVVIVDAERALRVNLNDLDDPVAYFRALDRRAQPRAGGVPMRA